MLQIDAGGADVVVSPTEVTVNGFNPIAHTNIEFIDLIDAGNLEILGDGNDNFFDVQGTGGAVSFVEIDGALTVGFVATSLKISGLDGDDTMNINEAAFSGLPVFPGTAIDSHGNAAFAASGSGPANIGIHFDGGAGNDDVSAEFTTAQDVTYFADDVAAANSGVVNIDGAVTLSFEGLAPLAFVGAGGSLTVDASALAALTTLTVEDEGAAGDGSNMVSGDAGFETTIFSGFDFCSSHAVVTATKRLPLPRSTRRIPMVPAPACR